MNHSPEPWIPGCWEQEQRGRKLYYVFRETPQEVFSSLAIYSGVEYGAEVHCSDWPQKAPGIPVIEMVGDYSDVCLEFSEEDQARAVACVNALAGIEDPEAFVREARDAMTIAAVHGWCGGLKPNA